MASVPNSVETLPKISIAWVGARTLQTDRRQTTDRRTAVGITCSRKHKLYQLEAIQRIICSYTNDMPYINALYCAAIPSLADRREQLSRKFFKSVQEPSSCFCSLLPNPQDPSIYNSTKIRKYISSPTLPYEEKSDIYFSALSHHKTS